MKKEKLIQFLNDFHIEELDGFIDFNLVEKMDNKELIDYLEELVNDKNALDIEVVYHAKAINILRREDPSLQISLAIADEYGYTLKTVHSELLASLLLTRENEENFYEMIDSIREE